ncbi:MAG: hypothetical protein NZ933_09150 [Bacteroidia bacterium]|nr:hypothetical protein [Bacteroidia bacterium]
MISRGSLSLLLWGAILWGQKPFEGSITYTIKLEGAMAAQLADMVKGQLPEKIVHYYRGNKSRVEAGQSVVIVNGEEGFVYVLNTSLQTYRKAAIKNPEGSEKAPKITKTNEKTKILKYPVEKYLVEISSEQGPVKMEVWAAPSLKVSESLRGTNTLTQGVRLDGVPLRISTEALGADLRVVYLATEISNTPPSETLFQLPEGYLEEKEESKE